MHRALVASVFLVAACGSDISTPDDTSGSGATQSTSGAGAAGSGGQGSASTTGSGVGASSSVGAGGSVTSTGTASGGASIDCDGLFEAACMAAAPGCVPVYDNICCPTCEMAGCADCIDSAFHHCDDQAVACAGAPACGTVPDWACSGAPPLCPPIDGANTLACEATRGCVVAECSPDIDCNAVHKCSPVSAGSCVSSCNSIPPNCPIGTTAESDGSCWTGFCIPAEVCGTF